MARLVFDLPLAESSFLFAMPAGQPYAESNAHHHPLHFLVYFGISHGSLGASRTPIQHTPALLRTASQDRL